MATRRQLLLPDFSYVTDLIQRRAVEDVKKALEELARSLYDDLGGAKSTLMAAFSNPAAATVYAVGGEQSPSASALGWTAPFAGTLKHLRVRIAVPVGPAAATVTVMVNGVATAVTATTTAATPGLGSDLTHLVSVAAGDVISFKYDRAGAADAGVVAVVALEAT